MEGTNEASKAAAAGRCDRTTSSSFFLLPVTNVRTGRFTAADAVAAAAEAMAACVQEVRPEQTKQIHSAGWWKARNKHPKQRCFAEMAGAVRRAWILADVREARDWTLERFPRRVRMSAPEDPQRDAAGAEQAAAGAAAPATQTAARTRMSDADGAARALVMGRSASADDGGASSGGGRVLPTRSTSAAHPPRHAIGEALAGAGDATAGVPGERGVPGVSTAQTLSPQPATVPSPILTSTTPTVALAPAAPPTLPLAGAGRSESKRGGGDGGGGAAAGESSGAADAGVDVDAGFGNAFVMEPAAGDPLHGLHELQYLPLPKANAVYGSTTFVDGSGRARFVVPRVRWSWRLGTT